jgi:hydrophobic/amphiphilic exporter-1 (mainly G- bacteria), HAE1 family
MRRVNTRKSSPDLMMVVNILSPDGTFDELYVSNYALTRVRDQLIRLDGVGDVLVFGAREYAIRVWLDPDKLSSLGLTGGDVVRALREQNVQVTGGALGQQPAPADAPIQLTVTTQGRFEDARQFRDVIVKATAEGRIVRLQDVARVELGARDDNSNAYLDGKTAVGIGIFQRPGSNALTASAGIKAKMDAPSRDFPKGLEYRIIYKPVEFIEQSIDEVYKTLIEAVLLVALVVLVFLQSWRASIIPILAIPISLIGTFAVMLMLGSTLNVLSLFGLVLAIGIVVDDAIVVVENIERNIALGMSPKDAAHKTMDEVGTAVIAIAIVLSAVFVPTAFIPGIQGAFYQQFALTIAVATILSAFNSLTLSPALGAILLKPHAGHVARRNPLSRIGRWAANRFNSGFDRMSDGDARTTAVVARRKVVMLGIYAALAGATFWIGTSIPTGFIPQLDRGYAIVVVQLPDGAPLTRTDAVVRKATEIIRQTPGVEHAIGITGLNGSTFTSTSNSGVVFATFSSFEERLKAGPSQSLIGIVGQLLGRLQSIPEAFIIAVPPPAPRAPAAAPAPGPRRRPGG